MLQIKILKLLKNDTNTICVSLNEINLNIKIKSLNQTIDLIGDKRYITSDIFKYR